MWLIIRVVINVHEIFYEDFVKIWVLKIDNDLNQLNELDLDYYYL
jgi:hypothetical protein